MTTLDKTFFPTSVADILTQNWWALAWRGVFALIFGVLVFFWPSISLVMLVMMFGAYALLDGIFALACAIEKATDKTSERKQTLWPMLLQGVVGIAAAVAAFVWPGITALVLLYLIAAWGHPHRYLPDRPGDSPQKADRGRVAVSARRNRFRSVRPAA